MVPTPGSTINLYVTFQSLTGCWSYVPFIPRLDLAPPPDGGQSRAFVMSSSQQREQWLHFWWKRMCLFKRFYFSFDPHVKSFFFFWCDTFGLQYLKFINDFYSWIVFTFCCTLIWLLLLLLITQSTFIPTDNPPPTSLPFFAYPQSYFKKFSLHSIISTAQYCWILHPLSSNSSLLCFTYRLCSLHDFPHLCHSS